MRLKVTHLSVLLGCAIVAGGAGCSRRERAPGDGAAGRDDGSNASRAGEDLASARRMDGREGANHLWSGTTTVFGIRLPTDMKPVTPAPPQVYRFEGATPPPQAYELIRRQVRRYKTVEEENGYLMRHAEPKQRVTSAAGGRAPVMALRIAYRKGGGTVLDIWLEKERNTAPESSRNTLPTVAQQAPPVYKANRAERISETMRVFNKIQNEEPLTEADRNSSYFK